MNTDFYNSNHLVNFSLLKHIAEADVTSDVKCAGASQNDKIHNMLV